MLISQKRAVRLGWVLSTAANIVLALACHAQSTAEPPWEAKATETMRLTEKDDGREVKVSRGGKLAIALRSTPGTGYRWTVVEGGAPAMGSPQESEDSKGDAPRPGADVLQVFAFEALQPGTASIVLAYARPWEPADKATKRFRVTVDVS